MKFSESDLSAALQSNPDLALENPPESSPRRMARRTGRMSESAMQMAVIAECDRRAQEDPRWGMIFAIPNGGHRHPAVAGKMKAEGVKAGVPDLFLPIPNPSKGFCGAFIELKVGRNRESEKQVTWASKLSRQGYFVATIHDDPAEVMRVIEWYLEGTQ